MGTRRLLYPLLAALAMAACGEQQQPESVAGPSLAGGKPVNPAACDPNSLNNLITAYFPGSSSNAIKNLKDALIAAGPETPNGLTAGFAILREIGNLSRNQTVDLAAGNLLAQGIIKCTFKATNATNFPNFPDSSIYNFTSALDAFAGGAFYVRPGGTATDKEPVQGALNIDTDTPNIQSGVAPLGTATWTSVLSGNSLGGGKALIYGYQVDDDPFTYEWATIPPATTFSPGAVVALCDGDASNLMLHESNIGVLAFQSTENICPAATYSLAVRQAGWGPRALAARLARVVVDAFQPTPLQATTIVGNLGTGGTASTFKSKFLKDQIDTVTLAFTPDPSAVLRIKDMPIPVRVFVSSDVEDASNGVNGVCVYLTGANNNGTPTILSGNRECDNTDPRGVSVITKSVLINGQPKAGFADFQLTVGSPGQLIISASSTDNTGTTGVVDRNGQIFVSDVVKVNVKP